ncbi:MAG: crossover junction endodeoxyribonuclease RuvC [Methanoregula sp.]|nr:crossover junction endodeoxyribonuclease RuvC [Methanoregula sp.]
MIVIGIDPGLARLGYGVLQAERDTITPIDYGCRQTPAQMPAGERLLAQYNGVAALLDRYQPACLALEQLFFTKNVTSAMSVSEVRGVILLAAQQRQIPVIEYTPNQVKQAITGSGRADKRQVQEMICRLLHLDAVPKPDDAADGLSIALCHIHVMR